WRVTNGEREWRYPAGAGADLMSASSMQMRVGTAVRGLTPGYFALVMASGIISVGMKLGGYRAISIFLLAVCIVSYVVLVVLSVWRLIAYRQALSNDFVDPRRAFGF